MVGRALIDEEFLAKLGVYRLRHPVPMTKLAVIRAAAQVLRGGEHREIFWRALLDWISTLELESEVIEALCVPVAANSLSESEISELQRSISKPSPLSDLFIGKISGRLPRLISWSSSHFGEPPTFFVDEEILKELSDGRVVPGILFHRLGSLEEEYGYPFRRQWAYEFSRLQESIAHDRHETVDHFFDSENRRHGGIFVTRRSHLVRSAYIRVMCFAFDEIELSRARIYKECLYVSPLDFVFLDLLPGKPPSWIGSRLDEAPTCQNEWDEFVCALIQAQRGNNSELMHLSTPLTHSQTYRGLCEIVTYLSDDVADPEAVYGVHNWLRGAVELGREKDHCILIESTSDCLLPVNGKQEILPAVLPAIRSALGYLHCDFIMRTPYVPANLSGTGIIKAYPRTGGLDLFAGDDQIGETRYWNWRWGPTYDTTIGPGCGVCATVSADYLSEVASSLGLKLYRFWRAVSLTRNERFGEWNEEVFWGDVPLDISGGS